MRDWIKRRQLTAYFILAYAISWSLAVPLALQAQGVVAARLPWALHYVTAFGPAVAGLVVAWLAGEPLGGLDVGGRSGRVRSGIWWIVGLASPLLLFAAAQVAGGLSGRPVPTWAALGRVNFLPDLGLTAWLLWFATSGCGEETGWRGFALPRLQQTHSAKVSSLLLAVGWAGWHIPAFFYVPSYTAIGPRVLPGFFLGILAGSIVLTWLYNVSGRSVLAVILWHASFNFVTGSPNASGLAAAVTSTLVMLWAIVVVWRLDGGAGRPRRALVRTTGAVVLILTVATGGAGLWYWAAARRFVSGDAGALDGIVPSPVGEALVLRNVSIWDGRGGSVQPGRSVFVNDGRIARLADASSPSPAGVRTIDASGRTLIPGLIDAHVHLMYDSGPDLLTRAPQLVDDWLAVTRQYPHARAPIVRRAQLKLKAGVTTMRVLGDGYYSLALRDDLARWDLVGPRVLTAGLHVNGPNGYVSGGLGAHLTGSARAEVAVELQTESEIERRLEEHIARGVDVIKIATTHGDMGFDDARADLPEPWVREIVRVAHRHGLKVTAHSYGLAGDWAAVRGGVDGIEHLVNVPRELPDDLIAAIRARSIRVTPTLSGSAYSVWTFLQAPERLYEDPGIVANVPANVRKDLYFTIRVLALPGIALVLLRQSDPMGRWEHWYRQSLRNTAKLYRAGVPMIFGTDTPFAFGNFFYSVMNEVRALTLAGLPPEAILRMATVDAAAALGIDDRVGTIEPGKLADLVLIDGDPLADIEALGRVELVIKEGRIVYRAPAAVH